MSRSSPYDESASRYRMVRVVPILLRTLARSANANFINSHFPAKMTLRDDASSCRCI